jgi:hypothetical protein
VFSRWGRPTDEAVIIRLPLAVGPPVPPGRTLTVPVREFSITALMKSSGLPSLSMSPAATVVPNSSSVSPAPGMSAVSWVKA